MGNRRQGLQIRRARPADAEAWVTGLVESMCATYATIMPPAFAEEHRSLIPQMVAERRRQFLEQDRQFLEPDRQFLEQDRGNGHAGDAAPGRYRRAAWLAIDPEGVVAVADAGPGPAQWEVLNNLPAPPAEVELFKLYALERGLGTGVGQRLLDAAVGSESAYLWMMAGNPRAEAFYRRNGFRPDGVTAFAGPTWHHRPMLRLFRS